MDDLVPSNGGIRGLVRLLVPAAFAVLLVVPGAADATGATAVSRVFGAVPVLAQGQTDTPLAIPMKIPAVFRATVGSVDTTITLAGSPNLTEDQFVYSEGVQDQTFYLFFETGDLAGRHFRITANGAATISVHDETGELIKAVAADAVAVHPYWTLATLFSSEQGLPETEAAGERPMEVIIPATDLEGTNPAAESIYYRRDGAWRRVGAPFDTTFDHVALEPDRPVFLRMNQEDDATLVMTGEVVMSELAIRVRSRSDGAQDTLVGLNRPLDQTLDELGLAGSEAFETTTEADAIKDRLILYSSDAGQNKVPTEAYYYYNGGWRLEGGDPGTDMGDTVIPAGHGFVIRTASQGFDTVNVWTNTFNP